MIRFLLASFLAFILPLQATTMEVMSIFQPLSLHGTDGAHEIQGIKEPLQAGVFARPIVMSGAVPEELIGVISRSHQIESFSPLYEVKEANLIPISGLKIKADLEENKTHAIVVSLDFAQFKLPAEIELSPRQLVKMVKISIHKTLESYLRGSDEGLKCQYRFINLPEGLETLKDLEEKILVRG